MGNSFSLHCDVRRKLLTLALLSLPPMAWSVATTEKRKVVILLGETYAENYAEMFINDAYNSILKYVEQDLNISFDPYHYPWKRLLQRLAEGDGLAFGLSKTKERMQTLRFSDVAFSHHIWIVTRSDMTFPYANIADLKNKSVGIVRGASYGEEFDSYKNKLVSTDESLVSVPSRLKKLLTKRTDVMLIDHPSSDPAKVEALINSTMTEVAADTPMPAGITFKVLSKPLTIDYIHFAILAEKDDGIIDKINTALRRAKHLGALPFVEPDK
ncbi:transporter substrate-binding domain-containing protein [Undibacterium sp. RTI2.1]|uniref:substrate-binding periplasmic protein n=1 Tax=unclassified Undibacterium TaxID=2630295 RepID=UPI002AB5C33B|nr:MULTISPECIES: transporter substrate-binding domain-containing protein [unclassified Undibacterium]MDY7538810.1 transporter substrate-binding domain-containing protein [Undibacterium sp. 5I1]MEB0031997.1 transporter substrate-binding domain-containing protein [Undibacterium sp. RTI2.1]MEB0118206.1 transporter substrate-binding domain-containing protein [Undibacterium sp. RTI2.2]MEB0231846.1 transporter substrate-binding domain-containing protein [Undibacterium sp. 10I3]MEB0258932.1 transport